MPPYFAATSIPQVGWRIALAIVALLGQAA